MMIGIFFLVSVLIFVRVDIFYLSDSPCLPKTAEKLSWVSFQFVLAATRAAKELFRAADEEFALSFVVGVVLLTGHVLDAVSRSEITDFVN